MKSCHIIYIALLFALTLGSAQSADWRGRIVSKTKRPLSSWLNPHVGAINVLVVDGKRFENVRGIKYFYLPVPGIDAIVFVTDNKDQTITYHVYKMDTKEDIAVNARSSIWGSSIGSAMQSDSVAEATATNITLCNRSYGDTDGVHMRTLIYIDLNRRKVSAEKDIFYSMKTGKLIREYNHIPPF